MWGSVTLILFSYILELFLHYLFRMFVFVCSTFCTFFFSMSVHFFSATSSICMYVEIKCFTLIIPDLPFCKLLFLQQQWQLFINTHIHCRCCIFCCNKQQQQWTNCCCTTFHCKYLSDFYTETLPCYVDKLIFFVLYI